MKWSRGKGLEAETYNGEGKMHGMVRQKGRVLAQR